MGTDRGQRLHAARDAAGDVRRSGAAESLRDIISDLAAGLVGGLGIVPGANLGDGVAVFEAVHGSAPDIAGKGLANPTALMQSARLMLAHLGERDAAVRMQSAIEAVYAEGKHLTGDVGGAAGTAEFTEAVIAKL